MIEICNVKKSYRGSWLSGKAGKEVLRGVSLTIPEGGCTGLVGGSGSGKSTLARLLLGLERPDAGEILIEGVELRKWRKEHPGKMSVVFQDYTASVNPRYTVEQILLEAVTAQTGTGGRGRKDENTDLTEQARSLLRDVNLPEHLLGHYPHELSGGQLQRVCIARAVAANPKILVLDEAISSLDVTVQEQVLELLAGLRKKYSMTYLFIAHDLQAVASICGDIYFLHQGVIEEHCACRDLSRVRSSYARSLLDSVIIF